MPEPPARGRWESSAQIDPFAVPLEEKLALIVAADESLRGDPRIGLTSAHALAYKEARIFASTEGARCEQVLDRVRRRASRPSPSSGDEVAGALLPRARTAARSLQAGWEHVVGLDMAAHGPRVADEAIALLTAPACPPGPHDRRAGRPSSSRCRYTSRWATPSSSTACSAPRRPTRARAS